MTLKRRSLLKAPLLASGVAVNVGTEAAVPDRYAPTFAHFIDTLLPADGRSPAASSLGIDTRILGLARRNRALGEVITLGCDWLDARS